MKNSNPAACLIRHGYYPEDTRVLKEAHALLEGGFSVDVICLKKPPQKFKSVDENINVYRIPMVHRRGTIYRYFIEYVLSFIMMFFVITCNFFRHKYKIIQVNTMPDFLVFSTLIPKLFGTKILLDLHEPSPELWIAKFGNNYIRWMQNFQASIEQWAISYADKAITVNEEIKKRFVERGAPADKIVIVRNVPDESFSSITVQPKLKNGFTILTHGAIEFRYGQQLLIEAIPLLKQNIDALKLFIVGDGENQYELEKFVNQNGLSDTVIFTGRVAREQIPQYIESADIGVVPLMPSPFSDLCQPNKLFEYIAFKKPVVAARLKAIEESFDDSSIKYYIPGDVEDLARCIIELYRDADKRKELTENAWKQYQKLRWSSMKNIYLNAVFSLID